MNKILKIALSIIGIFVVIFVLGYFAIDTNVGCDPPEKPANVPVTAEWKGGCDGGTWVELVEMKADEIRFRIYRDWNGDLLLDANFVYENCNDLQLTESNWSEHIAGYGNVLHIYSKYQSNDSYCQLVPVFPAYYEEKFE
jgi:hypothetical protein